MGSSSYGPMFPSTAYWLSIVGAVLISLSGIVRVLEGLFFQSVLNNILPGARIAAVFAAEGVFGILVGVLILFAAFRLKSVPAASRTWGIVIIVLSILSLFGGDGFFVGLLLALVGGILAVGWHPPVTPPPVYGRTGYGVPVDQPVATTVWTRPAAPPAEPGPAQRSCPTCGAVNYASARLCTACGGALT